MTGGKNKMIKEKYTQLLLFHQIKGITTIDDTHKLAHIKVKSMKTNQIISFLIILTLLSCHHKETEVNICSTIHGAHSKNPNYSFSDLYSFIEQYNPDVIGVEIRKEDMNSSDAYLSRYYPLEMRESLQRYKSKEIFGFDWLGEKIEGMSIPENYFKELNAKKMLKELNKDSTMLSKFHSIDSLSNLKTQLVLSASIEKMNDGRYDDLNKEYYHKMAKLLNNTRYQVIVEFSKNRDEQIAKNIIEIIKANKGKKLIFLMGADHRSYTLDVLKKELGNQIILNNAF